MDSSSLLGVCNCGPSGRACYGKLYWTNWSEKKKTVDGFLFVGSRIRDPGGKKKLDSGSGINISDQQQCNFILRNRQWISHKDFYSNGLLGTRIHPMYQQATGTKGQPTKCLKSLRAA